MAADHRLPDVTWRNRRARVRIPASPERSDNDAIMDAKHARVRLLDLRNRLAARLQRIDRHIHHRDEPLPADSEERAGELGNRETLESLDDETTVELRQVDHALARLDAGLFGSCESCRLPVGTDRLQLLPFATKCARCAARP